MIFECFSDSTTIFTNKSRSIFRTYFVHLIFGSFLNFFSQFSHFFPSSIPTVAFFQLLSKNSVFLRIFKLRKLLLADEVLKTPISPKCHYFFWGQKLPEISEKSPVSIEHRAKNQNFTVQNANSGVSFQICTNCKSWTSIKKHWISLFFILFHVNLAFFGFFQPLIDKFRDMMCPIGEWSNRFLAIFCYFFHVFSLLAIFAMLHVVFKLQVPETRNDMRFLSICFVHNCVAMSAIVHEKISKIFTQKSDFFIFFSIFSGSEAHIALLWEVWNWWILPFLAIFTHFCTLVTVCMFYIAQLCEVANQARF